MARDILRPACGSLGSLNQKESILKAGMRGNENGKRELSWGMDTTESEQISCSKDVGTWSMLCMVARGYQYGFCLSQLGFTYYQSI
jgi:hypothetical protein